MDVSWLDSHCPAKRASAEWSRTAGPVALNTVGVVMNVGTKPGRGRYCCTHCNWSVVLDDDSDRLPPCGNCGKARTPFTCVADVHRSLGTGRDDCPPVVEIGGRGQVFSKDPQEDGEQKCLFRNRVTSRIGLVSTSNAAPVGVKYLTLAKSLSKRATGRCRRPRNRGELGNESVVALEAVLASTR